MTGDLAAITAVALAVAAGAPARPVAIVGATILAPGPVGVALGVAALAARRSGRGVDGRLALLTATATDLRAGRSLRQAIATAAGTDSGLPFGAAGRRARLGAPMSEVVDALVSGFGPHGVLVGAGLRLVARTGAAGADVLDEAARLVEDDLDLAREVRAGSAPARVSAAIIGIAPVLLVAWQVADGTLGRALAVPGGAWVVGAGAGLLTLGVGVVLWWARRP